MSAEPSPQVETTLAVGTFRPSIVHGHVEFAWKGTRDRVWGTTRKSLDEAETFAGTVVDLIRNERIRQQRRGA